MRGTKAEGYPDPQGICDVAGTLRKTLENKVENTVGRLKVQKPKLEWY